MTELPPEPGSVPDEHLGIPGPSEALPDGDAEREEVVDYAHELYEDEDD